MATRPMGSPAAPPRHSSREAGEPDALSVILGVPADGTAGSAASQRLVQASILTVLKEHGQPLQFTALARNVPYDFFSLSQGLVELRQQGVISLEGLPGSEVVSLRFPTEPAVS